MPLGSHSLEIRKFFPVPSNVWNHSNNFTFAVQNPKRNNVHSLKSVLLLQYVFLWDISWLFFHILAMLICAHLCSHCQQPSLHIDLFLLWRLHSRPSFCWWNDFSLDVQNYPLCCPTEYFNLREQIFYPSLLCVTLKLLRIWSWLKNKTSKTANNAPTALSGCFHG